VAYGWAEHVGELELWIEAPSREDVFAEAVRAFGELVAGDEEARAPLERRSVMLDGDDPAVLLADWIGELGFLAETEGFVPDAVEELRLEPSRLHARLSGHRGAPPHLVKAVTYHRLAFEPRGDGWRAVAVLDV
jgi:SHS2 domain-containing protein